MDAGTMDSVFICQSLRKNNSLRRKKQAQQKRR